VGRDRLNVEEKAIDTKKGIVTAKLTRLFPSTKA